MNVDPSWPADRSQKTRVSADRARRPRRPDLPHDPTPSPHVLRRARLGRAGSPRRAAAVLGSLVVAAVLLSPVPSAAAAPALPVATSGPLAAAPEAAPHLVLMAGSDQAGFQSALDLARRLGGDVTLAYPPSAFVAHLRAPALEAVRRLPSVGRIENRRVEPSEVASLGAAGSAAVKAWNRMLPGLPVESLGRAAPVAPGGTDSPPRIAPPSAGPARAAPAAPGAPGFNQTSEFMAGDIVVSVVFLESSVVSGNCSATGHTETWDATRRSNVLSEIGEGVGFWTGRANRPSPLTFQIDDRGVVPTSCEPIRTRSDQEGPWLADGLTAMGFSATPTSYLGPARSFANSRRDAFGADWAYTVFVVDSLSDSDGVFSDGGFAYAYLNGPLAVFTYDNDGWGINRFNLVFAHETGHIFGALDEYASSGCETSDSWGYLNVPNSSCNNGGNTSDLSIMGEADEQVQAAVDVSTSARDAIGWRNPAPGAGGGSVVDVVRTTTASLTPYSPDPATDTTPTYSASGGNVAYPPGRSIPAVSISTVAAAEQNVDDGAWSAAGIGAADGAFDEGSEPYSFTPVAPLSPGPHTIGTRAVNQFGHASPSASDSLFVQGGTTSPPSAPTNARATPGNGSASVAFNAPSSNGGSPITGYRVTSSPGNLTATGTSSPITVGGLTNGVSYTFTVVATNAVGTSSPSAPSNAVVPTAPALPAFSVNDVSIVEGHFGTRSATFTITRSGSLSGASSVRYRTLTGTATGTDFYGLSLRTLSFSAGQASKTVTVSIRGDRRREPDETFTLSLSSPTGSTIADGTGVCTIRNDD